MHWHHKHFQTSNQSEFKIPTSLKCPTTNTEPAEPKNFLCADSAFTIINHRTFVAFLASPPCADTPYRHLPACLISCFSGSVLLSNFLPSSIFSILLSPTLSISSPIDQLPLLATDTRSLQLCDEVNIDFFLVFHFFVYLHAFTERQLTHGILIRFVTSNNTPVSLQHRYHLVLC